MPYADRKTFAYGALITFTALAETQTATISIQQDAAFLWTMFCFSSTDTTTLVFGGSLIQITDQGGNMVLQNTPVAIDTIAGSGQRPFILPIPYQFVRSGAIVISLQNTGIAAQVVRLTFHGAKVYA